MLALLHALALAAPPTCGDVKLAYAGSECCGASVSDPASCFVDHNQLATAAELDLLKAQLARLDPPSYHMRPDLSAVDTFEVFDAAGLATSGEAYANNAVVTRSEIEAGKTPAWKLVLGDPIYMSFGLPGYNRFLSCKMVVTYAKDGAWKRFEDTKHMTNQDLADFWQYHAGQIMRIVPGPPAGSVPSGVISLNSLSNYTFHSDLSSDASAGWTQLTDGFEGFRDDNEFTSSNAFSKHAYKDYEMTFTSQFEDVQPTYRGLHAFDAGIILGGSDPSYFPKNKFAVYDLSMRYVQLNVDVNNPIVIRVPFAPTLDSDLVGNWLPGVGDMNWNSTGLPKTEKLHWRFRHIGNLVDVFITPDSTGVEQHVHSAVDIGVSGGHVGFIESGTKIRYTNISIQPIVAPGFTMTGRVLGSKWANTIQVYTGEKTYTEYHSPVPFDPSVNGPWDALNSMTSEDAIAWVKENLVVGYEMTWDHVRYVPDVDGMGPGHLFTKETSVPVTGYPDEFTEFLLGQMVVLADGTPYTWDGTMYKTFTSEFWTASERQFYLDFVNTNLADKTEAQKAAAAASIQEVVDAVDAAPGTTPARLIWAYTIDAVLDALVEGGEMDWNNLAFHSPYSWPHSVGPPSHDA